MPETTGATEAQAAEVTQPQAGTAPTSPAEGTQTAQVASAAGQGGTDDTESISLEEARKLRSEANTLRKRLADADRSIKAAEDAKLSETERLAKENAELKANLAERDARDRERDLTAAAVAMATRLDFRDPELGARLLDRTAVELDEAGRPRNLERLLRDVLKDRAYLLRGTPDFGGGNRGTSPQGTDMDAFIRKAAGR